MSDLGSRLREARESRGLTLQQVEEQLRIRHAFLEALEEERYDALPGAVYTRGFIQSYGRFLGLPVEELLHEYGGGGETDVQVGPTTRIPTVLDEPLLSSPQPSVWPMIFLGLMVALALGVVVWFGYSRLYLHEHPADALRRYDLFARILPEAQPSATAQPTTSAPSGSANTPEPTASLEAAGDVSPEAPTAEPTQVEAVATPTPRRTLTPTPTATPTTEGSPETGEGQEDGDATPPPADAVTVVARVVETAWVSVVIDGTQVLATTLQPGQEYTWLGADDISLRVGNAGGLDLTVNGEALGTLGASGEVVDVTYNPSATP